MKSLKRVVLVTLAGAAGVSMVGWLDYATEPELSFSILYMIPVGLCSWYGGRAAGLGISLLAALIWAGFDWAEGRKYVNAFTPFWNCGVRVAMFMITAGLVLIVRELMDNLQELVRQRTAALEAEILSRKDVERLATEISSREQQRLGAELHDQLAGHLAGVAFMAKAIAESLKRKGLPEGPEAEKMVGFLNQSLRQLRTFCRLLAPVDSGNLEPGLTRLGAEVETAFGITCIVQADKDLPHLDLPRARLLFSVAQEAVRLAVERQLAKTVEISLTEEQENILKLVISDDGEPWTPPSSLEEQELALRMIRYRADTLGGEVTVARGHKGGSSVTCTVAVDRSLPVVPFPAMS
jgi:signal transduction histidine kinase